MPYHAVCVGREEMGNIFSSGVMSCDEFAQRSSEVMYLKLQSPTKRCYVRGDENGNGEDSTCEK
jgi:hypothetical protein